MYLSTTGVALVRHAAHTGRMLVVLCLLALLVLAGAGARPVPQMDAPAGRWMAPGPPTTPPPFLAATNGIVHIGG